MVIIKHFLTVFQVVGLLSSEHVSIMMLVCLYHFINSDLKGKFECCEMLQIMNIWEFIKTSNFCGKLEYLSKGTKIESKACCCGNSINLSIKVTGAK